VGFRDLVDCAPRQFVSDSPCRGSTFVTSGQANTTFMIVAFALRLADRLHGALQA